MHGDVHVQSSKTAELSTPGELEEDQIIALLNYGMDSGQEGPQIDVPKFPVTFID